MAENIFLTLLSISWLSSSARPKMLTFLFLYSVSFSRFTTSVTTLWCHLHWSVVWQVYVSWPHRCMRLVLYELLNLESLLLLKKAIGAGCLTFFYLFLLRCPPRSLKCSLRVYFQHLRSLIQSKDDFDKWFRYHIFSIFFLFIDVLDSSRLFITKT